MAEVTHKDIDGTSRLYLEARIHFGERGGRTSGTTINNINLLWKPEKSTKYAEEEHPTVIAKAQYFRKQKLGTIERTPEKLADSYERGATMEYLHTDQEDEIDLKA
ncbi:hypothetical protein BOTNAR_0151g00170 [Botryotinia narcissicola]|uniref:Uncharacterized protein n=1 Tax=Botryotinia narcissicola TaxID=278944 RepID=A0A4Z1IFJ0_9HELO|nr:hypothetical protein BOTNAR_0151g00170 [Botryotinia narcissicola]